MNPNESKSNAKICVQGHYGSRVLDDVKSGRYTPVVMPSTAEKMRTGKTKRWSHGDAEWQHARWANLGFYDIADPDILVPVAEVRERLERALSVSKGGRRSNYKEALLYLEWLESNHDYLAAIRATPKKQSKNVPIKSVCKTESFWKVPAPQALPAPKSSPITPSPEALYHALNSNDQMRVDTLVSGGWRKPAAVEYVMKGLVASKGA